jgi:D-arabinose 1-dehydrogenase-like Zn-dependent alcohol dehydrogenase
LRDTTGGKHISISAIVHLILCTTLQVKPGMKVGIIGIGGLGTLGIKLSKLQVK